MLFPNEQTVTTNHLGRLVTTISGAQLLYCLSGGQYLMFATNQIGTEGLG